MAISYSFLVPRLDCQPVKYRGKIFDFELQETFKISDEDIYPVYRVKDTRVMSRSAALIQRVARNAASQCGDIWLQTNKYLRGVYGVTSPGDGDWDFLNSIIYKEGSEFTSYFLRNRTGTYYLKELPSLAIAHAGIAIEACGPMYTFTDSRFAIQQAVEQAKFDLETNRIKIALLCGASSFGDELQMYFRFLDNPWVKHVEGAYGIVISKEDLQLPRLDIMKGLRDLDFGIITELINRCSEDK